MSNTRDMKIQTETATTVTQQHPYLATLVGNSKIGNAISVEITHCY